MIKEWCEGCEGAGYIEVPDYDWDESPIEPIRIECDECDGSGYVTRPVEYECVIYVVALYYDDRDLFFETPVEAYYDLEDAVKYCEDRLGYRVDAHESREVIGMYKLDRYAYFKIYKVNIK